MKSSWVRSAKWSLGVAWLTLTLAPDAALARPGGGSSFHGGGYHSSGGGYHSSGGGYHSGGGGYHYRSGSHYGGGDDGGGFAALTLSMVLTVFMVVGLIAATNSRKRLGYVDYSTQQKYAEFPRVASNSRSSRRRALEALRAIDPDFSVVLFEDFLHALFAQVHTARGAGQLAQYSAYMTPAVLERLAALGDLSALNDIVVGSLRYVSVSGTQPGAESTSVRVEYEANYTEISSGGNAQSYYVLERWSLVRASGAKSRRPERVRVFACPNCGAALEQIAGGVCGYCRKEVNTGIFDWVVRGVEMVQREERGPMLTATTEETGTNLQTIYDAQLAVALVTLQARDPNFAPDAFKSRVGLIFQIFQRAWAERDLAGMRPLMSDNLFETQVYWITEYKRQCLRNVTENARITYIETVRVTSDRWYDAITVRLYATSTDYTVHDDGQLVAGDRTRERTYSEYWTLIRSAGKSGAALSEAKCPNCGAELKVNMAGHCEYCHVKVTSGEFDWVLSRIEQDESYEG